AGSPATAHRHRDGAVLLRNPGATEHQHRRLLHVRRPRREEPEMTRITLLAPLLLALGISSSHASATPAPLLQTNADVQSVSSSGIPTAARGALTLAERSGREVQTIAFTPSNEFVVVAANRPLASPAFPAAIRDELE